MWGWGTRAKGEGVGIAPHPPLGCPVARSRPGVTPPSAAAVMLASLLYPLVMPPEYETALYGRIVTDLAALEPVHREEIEKFRATPAGKWCAAFYAAHRAGPGEAAGGKRAAL